ncbi:hypothetical protein EVAR_96217_1 [Eumeta japonica]|uniref:Uncharacterized protein n=1 Tax=Eumeta variegata TaxID=151549 RepID=A0A4C1WK40_EUMVA|nr:hypothetical protein EVAR_96217_1 [Eumeta japonica]
MTPPKDVHRPENDAAGGRPRTYCGPHNTIISDFHRSLPNGPAQTHLERTRIIASPRYRHRIGDDAVSCSDPRSTRLWANYCVVEMLWPDKCTTNVSSKTAASSNAPRHTTEFDAPEVAEKCSCSRNLKAVRGRSRAARWAVAVGVDPCGGVSRDELTAASIFGRRYRTTRTTLENYAFARRHDNEGNSVPSWREIPAIIRETYREAISCNHRLEKWGDLNCYEEEIHNQMHTAYVKTKRLRSVRRLVLPHANALSSLPAYSTRRRRGRPKPNVS